MLVFQHKRDTVLESLGITSSQSDTILFVFEHPGCTISELRDSLEVSHQAACGTATRLESKGIIEIKVSETDARARNLCLTEKGQEISERIQSLGTRVGLDALRGFTDEEVARLDAAMERILSNRPDAK